MYRGFGEGDINPGRLFGRGGTGQMQPTGQPHGPLVSRSDAPVCPMHPADREAIHPIAAEWSFMNPTAHIHLPPRTARAIALAVCATFGLPVTARGGGRAVGRLPVDANGAAVRTDWSARSRSGAGAPRGAEDRLPSAPGHIGHDRDDNTGGQGAVHDGLGRAG